LAISSLIMNNNRFSATNYSNNFIHISLALLLAVTLVACLASCGSAKAVGRHARSMAGGKLKVKVFVSEKVNQNNPIALDLLIVYDKDLLSLIFEMTSKEWFARREQIKRDFPEKTGFESWIWEWVPGQKIPVQKLPLRPPAVGGVIFANFYSQGIHRFRINPFKNIAIHLGEEGFFVESLK